MLLSVYLEKSQTHSPFKSVEVPGSLKANKKQVPFDVESDKYEIWVTIIIMYLMCINDL